MDSDTPDAMFEKHRERLRRLIDLRIDQRLRGRVDVSDILQETFLEAHRRMGDYDPHLMPPYLWLRMIAGQKLVDLHRHHIKAEKRSVLREENPARHRMPEASSIELAAHLAGNMTSVSQAVMRAELKVKIEEAISQMADLDREVLALRHFEQLNNSEIAQVLGISPNAASNRYVRALNRLKEIIPPNSSETDA